MVRGRSRKAYQNTIHPRQGYENSSYPNYQGDYPSYPNYQGDYPYPNYQGDYPVCQGNETQAFFVAPLKVESSNHEKEYPTYGRGVLTLITVTLLNLMFATISWMISIRSCPVGPDIHGYDCIWYGLTGWFNFYCICILSSLMIFYLIERWYQCPFSQLQYVLYILAHCFFCCLVLGGYLLYTYYTHDHQIPFDINYIHGNWILSTGAVLGINLIILSGLSFFLWIVPFIIDEFF